VDVGVTRLRSFAPALLRNPLILKWDLMIQKDIDEGTIPHRPDGIYTTDNSWLDEGEIPEEEFPRHLRVQLIENVKETGKLDWRIIYGINELEEAVVDNTYKWDKKPGLFGERFEWGDDLPETPVLSQPVVENCPSRLQELDSGIVDYATETKDYDPHDDLHDSTCLSESVDKKEKAGLAKNEEPSELIKISGPVKTPPQEVRTP
jgi:hypothetical protein